MKICKETPEGANKDCYGFRGCSFSAICAHIRLAVPIANQEHIYFLTVRLFGVLKGEPNGKPTLDPRGGGGGGMDITSSNKQTDFQKFRGPLWGSAWSMCKTECFCYFLMLRWVLGRVGGSRVRFPLWAGFAAFSTKVARKVRSAARARPLQLFTTNALREVRSCSSSFKI